MTDLEKIKQEIYERNRKCPSTMTKEEVIDNLEKMSSLLKQISQEDQEEVINNLKEEQVEDERLLNHEISVSSLSEEEIEDIKQKAREESYKRSKDIERELKEGRLV